MDQLVPALEFAPFRTLKLAALALGFVGLEKGVVAGLEMGIGAVVVVGLCRRARKVWGNGR
jgi:hypothetical protein